MALNTEKLMESLEGEEDQVLGRIVGDALQLVAKRGRGAWEATMEMLSSLDESDREEIAGWFERWLHDEKARDGDDIDEDAEEGEEGDEAPEAA